MLSAYGRYLAVVGLLTLPGCAFTQQPRLYSLYSSLRVGDRLPLLMDLPEGATTFQRGCSPRLACMSQPDESDMYRESISIAKSKDGIILAKHYTRGQWENFPLALWARSRAYSEWEVARHALHKTAGGGYLAGVQGHCEPVNGECEYVPKLRLDSELTEVIKAVGECRLDQDMPLLHRHLKKLRLVPAVHTLVIAAECTNHGTIRVTYDGRTEASLVVTALSNCVSSVFGGH